MIGHIHGHRGLWRWSKVITLVFTHGGRVVMISGRVVPLYMRPLIVASIGWLMGLVLV